MIISIKWTSETTNFFWLCLTLWYSFQVILMLLHQF
jgi:hypothetical protein